MLIDRRALMQAGLLLASAVAFPRLAHSAGPATTPILRAIPSTGEQIPVVGLGSWITFNVGNDPELLAECAQVVSAFLRGGGRMIDSSPMYGSAQGTIGHSLATFEGAPNAFSADKVWTSSPGDGPSQIERSRSLWRIPTFDLLQVHNLVAWQDHLQTLRQMKADGQLRYVGVTTSHGRRHDLLERIMTHEQIDFVQVTYNIRDRAVENRILPLARERGIGVIVNRPYRRGALVARYANEPLPDWVAETGATSWPQFLLRFIISHPAVTCAIPATTSVAHVRENLAAAVGPLPDEALRQRMIRYVEQL